eukprot:7391735-Prymnesium_polylepis.1
MATAAAGRVIRDDGAWDEIDAIGVVGFASSLDPGFGATVTYKRVQGQWIAWTMITQSAALKTKGISGRGLYTLQPLRAARQTSIGSTQPTRIGRYSGTIIAAFPSIESPNGRAFIEERARAGSSSLLSMRVEGVDGWAIVDGNRAASAPYIQRANDYRSLAPRPNIRFTANGYAECINSDVPAANLQVSSLAQLANSELLVDYGDDFWRLQKDLGNSPDTPIVTNASVVQQVFRALNLAGGRHDESTAAPGDSVEEAIALSDEEAEEQKTKTRRIDGGSSEGSSSETPPAQPPAPPPVPQPTPQPEPQPRKSPQLFGGPDVQPKPELSADFLRFHNARELESVKSGADATMSI